MKMSNQVYDVLKWIAQYLLPCRRYFIFCVGWYLGASLR